MLRRPSPPRSEGFAGRGWARRSRGSSATMGRPTGPPPTRGQPGARARGRAAGESAGGGGVVGRARGARGGTPLRLPARLGPPCLLPRGGAGFGGRGGALSFLPADGAADPGATRDRVLPSLFPDRSSGPV